MKTRSSDRKKKPSRGIRPKRSIKAWAIVHKRTHEFEAAFSQRTTAETEMQLYPRYHANDMIVACTISF